MKTKFGQNAAVNVKTSINSSPPQSILSQIGKVVDVILDDSHPLYKEYGGENSIGVIFVVDNIWFPFQKIRCFFGEFCCNIFRELL